MGERRERARQTITNRRPMGMDNGGRLMVGVGVGGAGDGVGESNGE